MRYQSTHLTDSHAADARKIVDQYPQGDLHLTIDVSLPWYGTLDVPDYFCSTLFREHPYAKELSEVWDSVDWQCMSGGSLRLGGYPWDHDGGGGFARQRSAGEDGNEWVLLADWYTQITGVEGLIVHWPIRWPDLTARRFDQVDAVIFWNP